MSTTAKTASERQFQEDLVQRLGKYRWKAPEGLDGNRHKVTVDDLIASWREILGIDEYDAEKGTYVVHEMR